MEAFDVNTNTTNSGAAPIATEPTNPFETDLTAPAVCPQKAVGAGLLLDFGGSTPVPADFQAAPPFNNGHTNGNLYAFLDRSPNGKVTDEEDEHDDDDDSGPENSVEGADEKRVPTNPFGADIELQNQQLSEFDPVNEPRHDTPTPPADEVPGVIGLVSDNVAESGEESEDEWNFYRVEPSEKQAQPSSEKEQQTKQEVCQEPPQKVEETDDNMESQLNPNAAEFIPSPTHGMPSMEDFILSQSKNDKSMDDVLVPSSSDFEKEVSSRPSEVDFENSFFNSSVSSVNTSELLEIQCKRMDESQEFSELEKKAFVNPLTVDSDVSVEESFKKESSVTLDESAQFSTKAEYGDESTTSFMTTGSDFQKIIGTTNITETSLSAQDFLASEKLYIGNKEEHKSESSLLDEQESSIQQDDVLQDFQNEPVHISFEIQKEIAPHMESQPERVKVDSVDHSPTLESEPETEPEGEHAPGAEPEGEPAPETDLEAEPVPETDLEAEPVPETDLEAEPVPETDLEAEPVPETDLEAEPVPETDLEAEPVSETDLKAEPVSETDLEAEPVSETDPEAEPASETEREAEAAPETEREPELELDFSLPEDKGFVDNMGASYKNEELFSHISSSDLVVPSTKDVAENSAIPEEPTASEIENIPNNTSTPRIDEIDFLNEDTKQLHDVFEFSQTVEKPVLENTLKCETTVESNFMEEAKSRLLGDVLHSEYLADEFQENLAVRQENQNLLSNEISTPEYEKLEKVVEASEVFKEHFNTLTDDIAVNFSSVCDSNASHPTEGALLESAHPDQVELLNDACGESATVADFITPLDFTSTVPDYLGDPETNASDLVDPVPSDEALLEKSPIDTELFSSAPVDSQPVDLTIKSGALGGVLEETVQESAFFKEVTGDHFTKEHVPLHIPSSAETETLQHETLESAQAPPPTPLITEDAGEEPLNFSRGAEDITEVVEKLSATPKSSEISSTEESKETPEVPVDNTLATETNSEQTVKDNPVNLEASDLLASTVEVENQATQSTKSDRVVDDAGQSDLAAAAVAATGIAAATAAVAATVAIATHSDKSVKKELPPKKSAVSIKDKRPSAEKPKTAARTTVPSRLTATAAKPKSPTSPVKSPIAPKVPLRQTTSTVPTKPLAKTQVTKATTARPQTVPPSRTTTVTATKAKPLGSQSPAKPAMQSVGLSRTKPTPPEKKPLTNGDIKSAPKRPEQLLTKTSTAKLTQRPASAPAARAISKTTSAVSATTRTKSPLNGPSKPKVLSSVTQVKTVTKTTNEKEIKESANKQISTRTTTTVRSAMSTTASKTAASATRKIESKIVANGKGPALKPSSMVKTTTSSSKIPPKKPATTTRLKSTKTGSIVEKTETVQGSNTVVATNEVKSEVLIETTQTAA